MIDDVDSEESGEAARESASMRWKAVEAFNGAPGLSPAARRIGMALITCMDATSRACFPSEPYLAALCDLHVSAVKKAKVALRKADLIHWHNPGGPRHQSRYLFNWAKLDLLAGEAKARSAAAVEAIKSTRVGTNGSGQHVTTASRSVTVGKRDSHGAVTRDTFQGTQIASQSTRTARQSTRVGTPKVPSRVPDTSHYPPTDTAQQYHGVSHATPDDAALQKKSENQKSTSTKAESPKALEGRPVSEPRERPQFFPALNEAFADDHAAIVKLNQSAFNKQQDAAQALARHGVARAREIIMRNP